MTTLDWLLGKATDQGADLERRPIEIPDVGRDDLAGWFQELGFTAGVEIGVKTGDYSVVLCEANPQAHIWSVDPWLHREEYYDRRGQARFDGLYETAVKRLGQYENNTILRMKSSEALRAFKRRSLDFVYIDGHHNLYNAVHDLHYWTQKLRPGGIVAGHDYVHYRNTGVHVVEAVHAHVSAYRIDPWFVLGRKHAPKGEHRDRHRSFCWVRPEAEIDWGSYDPTKGGQTDLPCES